jgi:hypothetical protein
VKRTSLIWVAFLAGIISLNLAWEHQIILTQMVKISDYYDFHARAPFTYRILPALICRLFLPNGGNVVTGLNEPLDSYYSIFQMLLDSSCLLAVFVFMSKIVKLLNPQLQSGIILLYVGVSELMMVVFGYFMVPNKALFYPYDFPDLCIATIIFFLCIRLGTLSELLLPVAVFLATLNKETAVFYSGLYLVFSIESRYDWKRIAVVLLASACAFVAARVLVLLFVRSFEPNAAANGPQFEIQLSYTLQQFRNPLFLFAMLNICSYFYAPVWAIRTRFDRTDVLILAMIILWILIMSLVGIFRQLRLFVPASLLLFIILSRHLTDVVKEFSPNAIRPFLVEAKGKK